MRTPGWAAGALCALALGAGLGGSAHAQARFAKDRILVKFRDGAEARALAAPALQAAGVARWKTDRGGVSRVELSGDVPVTTAIKRLEASGLVEYAEPDYRVHAGQTFATDPSFGSLWGLHNAGQDGGTADADIDAPEAWDVTTGSSELVVAVIDSGVDYLHPDLAPNMWVNPGEIPGNGIDDDANGYVDDVHGIDAITGSGDPMDDNEHGTHVAGTLGAAADNGEGVTGVAWDVRILACKFLDETGSGFTSDGRECVEYVTALRQRGVPVVLSNNSWGGPDASQSLRDAIAAAGEAGILFVAAAGNDAEDGDAVPHYPSGYLLDVVLSVASSDRDDLLSGFSNYGAHSVDLAAPGSAILSTVPGGAYASFSGTSMAAPHASGAAALLFAYAPGAAPVDVRAALLQTADPVPALAGGRPVGGGGRLNAGNALTGCEDDGAGVGVSLADGFEVFVDDPERLEVRLLRCTDPILGASASVDFASGADPLTLRDDGVAPDDAADDGVYTASWTPETGGSERLDFDLAFPGGSLQPSVEGTVVVLPTYVVEPGAFDWIDPAGAPAVGVVADEQNVEIDIGFDFEFYGETRDSVVVSSNGYLTFGSEGLFWVNEPVADGGGHTDFIAPYWDDLDPGSGGSITQRLQGTAPDRRLTITWSDVPYWGQPLGGGVHFQVTLFESAGRIEFQYLDVTTGAPGDRGASATVGIEHRSRVVGEEIGFDEVSVTDGGKWVLRTRAACDDGLDNDGDGLVDHPADQGCSGPGDDSEQKAGGDPGGGSTPGDGGGSASSSSSSSGMCGLVGIELLAVPALARRLRRRDAQPA